MLSSRAFEQNELLGLTSSQNSEDSLDVDDGMDELGEQFMESPQITGRPSVPFQPEEPADCGEPLPAEMPYDDYEYEMNNQIEL